jgi:di/tricarboxylate transporter
MLISVAIKAGTIKILAGWVTSNLSPFLVVVVMTIVGSIMSFFSSTLGVVCPTLFPIVPSITASSGLSPMLIFTAIVIGSQATAISPFSSGGALTLGSCSDEDERKQLFYDLIFKAVPTCATASILVSMVLYFIL